MALVNFLRFNRHMGGIISDEEYWDVRFRRRLYCDNLHPLLGMDLQERWNVNVVYGGVGYPSVHREVITHTRRQLEKIGTQQKKKSEDTMDLREVTRIAFECLQDAIRRRIDQKLSLYFGITSNDVNSGTFNHNGESCKIGNEMVRETARKYTVREKTDALLRAAMDCKAAVFGYDPDDGITAYYLSVENSICGYNHEGFDSIGSGKYASGLSFGQTFNTRNLKMRKAGFTPSEGVYELVASALLAEGHFKEVGGNMNFVVIDGSQGSVKQRYRECFDETARLTGEIVRASMAGILDKKYALQLIDNLVFLKKPFGVVEAELFKKTRNQTQLHFLLRGYKRAELPVISREVKSPVRAKRKK